MSFKHPLLPQDATSTEVEIMKITMSRIYESAETIEDKFLIAFCFDLGYSMSMAGYLLGVSEGRISQKLKKTREKLKKTIKNEYNIEYEQE